jgi:outer membrane protein OmpA-like peptidoglycan-associated protein
VGLSNLSFAQTDQQGCSDHPMFSRMPDFYIDNCNREEFGQLTLKNSAGEDITAEGYKYRIEYYLKKGVTKPSALQLLKNFENAVKSINGTMLFKTESLEGFFKIEKGGKVFWVYMYPDNGEFYIQTIVEEEKMEQEIVANAESLERDIAMTGHATVSGIYFDFDKDIVKPESETALVQVGKLMRNNPDLKLYVVGHTDNKGKFQYNMDLSLRRAKAVVQALVESHGVDGNRLKAYSVGPLSPVLSNKNEKGRTKNRRVELVEQ